MHWRLVHYTLPHALQNRVWIHLFSATSINYNGVIHVAIYYRHILSSLLQFVPQYHHCKLENRSHTDLLQLVCHVLGAALDPLLFDCRSPDCFAIAALHPPVEVLTSKQAFCLWPVNCFECFAAICYLSFLSFFSLCCLLLLLSLSWGFRLFCH